ncbi:hypothetical protein LuPra_00390 [Luteitalea pratensis]|uniref:Ice-binding protein C-terminal domain-containing protein n=1 Tax=Luteitalea pratensis TaxID=1855912 RepID=A0A143PG46_LUTPR|nr:PEP-CTERM sorting domain-containing protein [Luteitalea pratensis]AMY07223.1 hypothetical protein LuPra_00390 [Luteitalea pratensis]
MTASPQLTVDDSPFLLNVPPTLAAGASVGPVLMLRVNISPAALPGTYGGTLAVLGGSSPGALGALDDETFEVIVRQTSTAVPEPATWLLAANGSAVIGIRRRRPLTVERSIGRSRRAGTARRYLRRIPVPGTRYPVPGTRV